MRLLLLSLVVSLFVTPGFAQNNGNTTPVCHNGQTIYVNGNALQAHLDHGDTPGDCEGCIDPSLMDNEIFCLAIFDPVCGCDGITYSNGCVATYFNGVTSFTQGPCGCVGEPLTDVFCPLYVDPVCGCNGVTYSNSCFANIAGVTSWTDGPCNIILDPKSNLHDGEHDHAPTVYPNPASNNATIQYEPTQAGSLKITMYDLAGKEIKVLFNRQVKKSEKITVDVDVSSLENGTYLMRMVLPDGSLLTDKLLVAHS